MLKPGLYEQVINQELSSEIDDEKQFIKKDGIDKHDAPRILSHYLSEVIEKGLSSYGPDDTENKVILTNKIISLVSQCTGDDEIDEFCVIKNNDNNADQLLAIGNKINNAQSFKQFS